MGTSPGFKNVTISALTSAGLERPPMVTLWMMASRISSHGSFSDLHLQVCVPNAKDLIRRHWFHLRKEMHQLVEHCFCCVRNFTTQPRQVSEEPCLAVLGSQSQACSSTETRVQIYLLEREDQASIRTNVRSAQAVPSNLRSTT